MIVINQLNNPHDTFFKKTLEDVSVVKGFISNYLSAETVRMIDLNSLEAAKGNFVDDDLREFFTDMLFKVNLNQQEARLYFLFEHKSKVHQDISLQLLGYMLNIWKLAAKQTPGKLPVIIPLLIYHGRYQWNVGLSLSDLLQQIPPSVQKHVPDYEYVLFDLSRFSEEDIKGGIKGKLFFEVLSNILKEGFSERVVRILELINELEKKEGAVDYIETVILYILEVRDDLTVEKIIEISREHNLGKENLIMSIAERLRSEGMEKGMEKEKVRTARKMLMKGMPVDEVVELTEMSKEAVLKLTLKIDK